MNRRTALAGLIVGALVVTLTAPGAAQTISVSSATYGAHLTQVFNPCKPVISGNATSLVKSKCDGQKSCLFTVDDATFPGGDPAFGCAKDFIAQFGCSGDQIVRTVSVGGSGVEADGKTLYLTCATSNGIQVTQATFGGQVVAKWNSCNPAPAGNWTNQVKAECNGTFTCNFLVQVKHFPSDDPAQGCFKSFSASYLCPGDPQPRSVSIVATSTGGADGQTVQLVCPQSAGDNIQVTSVVPSPTTNDLTSVVRQHAGTYVAVGAKGTAISSSDGLIWSNAASINGTPNLKSVAYNGTRFVAVGNSVNPDPNFFWSSDGRNWTGVANPPYTAWRGVTYPTGGSGNFFVAVGGTSIWNPSTSQQDTTGYTMISGYGDSWQDKTALSSLTLSAAAWSGTTMVAVGEKIVSSADGVNWTVQTKPDKWPLNAVTWGPSMYIAVGSFGDIVTSPDGVVWTNQTSSTTKSLNGVACSNDASNWCVAVGPNVLLTSTDGVTWSDHPALAQPDFTGVAWTEGAFTVVGTGGKIWRITNP